MELFKSKIRTFFTDDDGLNPKDFLLLVGTVLFIIIVMMALVFLVVNKEIPPDLFKVLDYTNGVFMTIFGGTMGVQAAESAGNYWVKKTEIENRHNQPPTTPEVEPHKNDSDSYDPI